MGKQHLNLSVESELIKEARFRQINISDILEQALMDRIDKLQKQKTEKQFPFEYCEETLTDHMRQSLFGTAAIKARRCHKCSKIWFVNDPNGEFTICRNCFEKDKII